MSDPTDAPQADPARHHALEQGLAALAAPADGGRLVLIVVRPAGGERQTPGRVLLTPEGGVPGDGWARRLPLNPEAQVSMMSSGVARLIAGGQPLSLFGDNLLVDLDVSVANLPVGSRLRVGAAVLEVTPKPHNGCLKFARRFGDDALRLTADPRFRHLRLRGLYARVVEAGDVSLGAPIAVLSRG